MLVVFTLEHVDSFCAHSVGRGADRPTLDGRGAGKQGWMEERVDKAVG